MERYIYSGLAIALLMAGVLSLFASPEPDGLERVAEDKGFMKEAEGQEAINSPFPDYAIPGVPSEMLASSLAGIFGTAIVFGFAFVSGKVLSQRKR